MEMEEIPIADAPEALLAKIDAEAAQMQRLAAAAGGAQKVRDGAAIAADLARIKRDARVVRGELDAVREISVPGVAELARSGAAGRSRRLLAEIAALRVRAADAGDGFETPRPVWCVDVCVAACRVCACFT